MRAIERSFLTGLLITSALPLAVVLAGAPKVSAETIIVPTVPGSLDGANGADGASPPGDPNGQPGGDGLPANADAGYSAPRTTPLIPRRRPAEMAVRAGTAQEAAVARAVTAAMGVLRTQRRRPLSFPVRRKRTPLRTAAAVEMAAAPEMTVAMAAAGAMAAPRLRRPRRPLSPARRKRTPILTAGAAASGAMAFSEVTAMAARAAPRPLLARRRTRTAAPSLAIQTR